MKILDIFTTLNNSVVKMIEKKLTDNSLVYDIEFFEMGDVVMTISPFDKKDAEKRFELLKKALS